jgi:hypothetical protein
MAKIKLTAFECLNVVQSAPLKKNKLPKDASRKIKSKHTSSSILSHCTPEKGMKHP